MALHRLRPSADDGFTVIEAVIALLIAGLVLSAVGISVISSVRASATSRINQQASDVAETQLELARSQTYSNLAMSTTDATLTSSQDSRLLSSGCPSGASLCVAVPNPTGTGSVTEGLVTTNTTAYITQHIKTVTSNTNKVPFTVATYITKPSDEASATYKRVTVYVSWTEYGQTHTRVESTLIASTQRGLPLPHFKLTSLSCSPNCTTGSGSMTAYANPGSTVIFGFKVTNLGARDAWDFTSNNEPLGWSYYLDNGDGVLTTSGAGADTVMTDSDGDGVRDTGEIDTNAAVTIWATRAIPSDATNGSSSVNFTATSVAQPNLGAGTSTQSVATTVVVQTGVITPTPSTTATTATPSASPTPTTTTTTASACSAVGSTATSGTAYYLHNTSSQSAYTGTGSTAKYPMSFSTVSTPPVNATLYDYSTDDGLGSHSGRTLTPVSSFNATNSTALQTADFRYQVTNGSYKLTAGTAYVTIWAQPASGSSTDTVSLKAAAVLLTKTGVYTATEGTSATLSGTGCGSWRQFTLAINTNSFTPGNNAYIEIALQNVGTTNVQLAFDTTSYPAQTVWPVG